MKQIQDWIRIFTGCSLGFDVVVKSSDSHVQNRPLSRKFNLYLCTDIIRRRSTVRKKNVSCHIFQYNDFTFFLAQAVKPNCRRQKCFWISSKRTTRWEAICIANSLQPVSHRSVKIATRQNAYFLQAKTNTCGQWTHMICLTMDDAAYKSIGAPTWAGERSNITKDSPFIP